MISRKFQNLTDIAKGYIATNDGRCKHWTFILQRSNVLAMGQNKQYKTHPEAAKFGHRFDSLHSELDACLQLRWRNIRWDRVTLVNIRLNREGIIRNAKPCKCCQKWLQFIGVRNIWYSTETGFERMRI